MGRRWGKTTMAGACAVAWANAGAAVAWVVPTYKNARAPWRFAEQAVAPAGRLVQMNRTDRVISFPRTGGWLGIYTADNPVGILGEAFDAVIVDEAARIAEDVWSESLLPTLADRDGRAMLISTPKGRNWFWREWRRGMDGAEGYAAWQAPTVANPSPSIRRAAELARDRVSERTYRQEWLAEFIEDGGEVFRNVRAAVAEPLPGSAALGPPNTDRRYVFGVDWGRDHDYTVVAVMDVEARALVAADRYTNIPTEQQINRVIALYERYRPEVVVAERNSLGAPLIDLLFYQHGLPVQPFATTHQSKARIIDALALAFERRAVRILDLPWLVGELEAYAILKTTALQLPTYGAPAGMHDDGVMALALAWSGVLWATGGDV